MFSCFLVLGIAALAGIGYVFFTGLYTYELNVEHFRVIVNSHKPIFVTDKKFLSVALDTSFMGCFVHSLSERDWKQLLQLSMFLSPAYLRLGGTQADELLFVENDATSFKSFYNCAQNASFRGQLIMSGDDWLKINNFSRSAGFDFIMDLNVLLRTELEWNSSNAQKLINFSKQHKLPLNFQLGNEPNSFPHVFNVSLSGEQLAEDFNELRRILNISEIYRKSKLVGPDVTKPKTIKSKSIKYLGQFLTYTNSVDAASWHQYYLNGRVATYEDFLNPEVFDLFPIQAEYVNNIVRSKSPNLPIWLSETGSAYGGGAPFLSDRFIASFLWLDKLGVAARSNISVVVRQSLFKDNYALISPYFTPSPDYWISFFYKNLVGDKVLRAKTDPLEFTSKYLRFYAHCLANNAPIDGSVVVFGMNLMNTTQLVSVKGIIYDNPIHSFTFRAENNDLKSRTLLLNDKVLNYDPNNMYDLLRQPKEIELPLVIPYQSIVFWIFKEVTNSTCRTIKENDYL